MNNQSMTPGIVDLEAKASGNFLQMRGLMHVLSSNYVEGMSLDELQMAVGTAVQQQLQQSINSLDPTTAQTVASFLQNLDYALTLEHNKEISAGRSR